MTSNAKHRAGWLAGGLALAALSARPGLAWSQDKESGYCQKVRGYAGGDAAVLIWPKIVVEGIRFPSTGRVDASATIGSGFQARAGLSISPIDIFRGVREKQVADADCELQEVTETLRELVVESANDKTLPALRMQMAYLELHRDEWQKLLSRAKESLTAGLITTVELQDLRRFVGVLERKMAATRGELQKLETRVAARPRGSLTELSKKYTQLSMELENKRVALRALDPWEFRLRGAATIPEPGSSGTYDWYALAEVAYSLGGLVHGGHDERALKGRQEELRAARYELPSRLHEMRRLVGEQISQARSELEVVRAELESINQTQSSFSRSDVPTVQHARAMLTLEQISLESDQVFLRVLIESLSTLEPGFAPTPTAKEPKEKERS